MIEGIAVVGIWDTMVLDSDPIGKGGVCRRHALTVSPPVTAKNEP